uniref:Uncharacterized protein n=1 Tax=Biomphalaria glabrata TaxID=6526 RepID=A0A2C9L924_BIOGL
MAAGRLARVKQCSNRFKRAFGSKDGTVKWLHKYKRGSTNLDPVLCCEFSVKSVQEHKQLHAQRQGWTHTVTTWLTHSSKLESAIPPNIGTIPVTMGTQWQPSAHPSSSQEDLRNEKGSLIPLNGKIVNLANSNHRAFTLEVVRRFQSVQPKPNSLELTQYAESLKNKLMDIQERISDVEASMENMHKRRKEKISQEISKIDSTVSFLKKRLEESETIEWRGMFVKNPLW